MSRADVPSPIGPESGVDPPSATGGSIAPAMGQAVSRGAAWMMSSTVGAKLLSVGAQIALGWWLSHKQWGIYGVAVSWAFFLQIFRDGGVRHLLVQRGSEYATLSGPIFWMALAFNLATALVTIALSPFIAGIYGYPDLIPLLIILGLNVPLSTVALVTTAKLRIDLRFNHLARMAIISATIRYGGSVLLAWWGMGPLAFVLPIPFMTLFDTLYCYILTRDKPWRRPALIHTWPALFGASKWLILLAAAIVTMDMGDYAMLGLFVKDEIVGIYYFAFQLIAQTGALLASNIEQVLLPALARLQDEPERRRQAVVRSLHALALVSAPASLLLAALAAPLEMLLWHGRWAQAVPAVQVLGLFYPARAIFVVATSLLLAVGRFKAAAILVLVLGIGRMLAAVAAGVATDDPTALAWIIGSYVGISCLIGLGWALRDAGVGLGQLSAAIAPSWLVAALAAALVLWLDQALQTRHALVRLALGTAIGGGAFLVIARLALPGHLRDAMNAFPARLRSLGETWLRLRPPSPPPGSSPQAPSASQPPNR